jgi:hypothetical protein
MNAHHAVVDLSTAAIPLATCGHRVVAALARARLVHTTDGLGVRVLLSHHLLAAISEPLLFPLDRFQKALERPRRCLEFQRNGLCRFAVQVG